MQPIGRPLLSKRDLEWPSVIDGTLYDPGPLLVAHDTRAIEFNLGFSQQAAFNRIVRLNIQWPRQSFYDQVLRLAIGTDLFVAPHPEIAVEHDFDDPTSQTPLQRSSAGRLALPIESVLRAGLISETTTQVSLVVV